ncbi:MAG: PQQ-dependent sugar dehydrogenase [Actinobacteria bacterium]|nr:PQQ-dependent sugar dehydrogenase [Actinomycetota bacterium]
MLRSPRAVGLIAVAALTTAALFGSARPAAAAPAVALEPVSDLTGPTAMAIRAGDPAAYVALQKGTVVALTADAAPRTVLDVSALTRARGEQGLLGLAFSPNGTKLYVHYSGAAAGETVLEEYAFTGGVADPATRRVVLTVPQPQPNHNGGQLAFGPDGHLYLGLGDGGGRDDAGSGHAPGGNGQSLQTLLGKVLRIDPSPSGGMAYTVPDDNPYADGGGRPEIYVSGLRNPWRFSFDRKTGDLWIADVGQDKWEEVTRLAPDAAAGANLGWNRYDGAERYLGDSVLGTVMPQIVTSHADGNCSITGGYLYRGSAIPSLRGWYVYTDFCNGSVKAAKVRKDGTVRERDLGLALPTVSSFGQDADGELYLLSLQRGVVKLVPAT